MSASRIRIRILVAGLGNIFLGDDGVGVEVVRGLARREFPEGVRIVDFGIRGIDLTYALLEGYDRIILVDAMRRGGPPGTVTASMPCETRVRFRSSIVSRFISEPLRPVAFKPYSFLSRADQIIANRSPPTPVMLGSTTASTAAAVTAASTAFPPRSSTARPAAVASGWLVAIAA